MPTPDIHALSSQVLLAAFIISLLFGAIAQRTHFCTMGALSDAFNMGDWQRMRQWACAAGVAMLGFALLVYFGQIDPSKTLYAGSRILWLSALVGGLMFGFGMVLASGCGAKTLVRIGGGSLKSVVVFLVMGLAGLATLKGITAVARVNTVDLVAINSEAFNAVFMPASALFDIRSPQARILCSLVIGLALMAWALRSKDFRSTDNLLAGLGVGLLITAMWWASGHLGFVAEHPDTLQEAYLATNSGRIEAMSFVAPAAYTLDWLLLFSDKAKTLSLGIASALGVISGSALVALLSKSFRWEGFGSTEDLANHIAGGLLMGIGGVTAMGCSIGQGLSGISTLATMSFIALGAIMAGAIAAFKYQMWRLEMMD